MGRNRIPRPPCATCGVPVKRLSRTYCSRRCRGGSESIDDAPSKWPEYQIWADMKARCNPGHRASCHYYDRGIRVCDEWVAFSGFIASMGRRPTALHSLDRIDNDGNYEPRNCRWATRTEQQRNTRRTKRVEFNGRIVVLAELAESAGIALWVLKSRLKRGWASERLLEPVEYRRSRDRKDVYAR
jgi:hypothetical protein